MSSEKQLSVNDLAGIAAEFRAGGRRLVFTNGVFDLLHVGHVRYLQAARALKGPSRPINPQEDRAEVLAALACVDFVTIFHTERVTELVRAIRPQVYAKGGDYTIDSLDAGERAALEEVGAEIRILPLVAGRSTTAILERSRE